MRRPSPLLVGRPPVRARPSSGRLADVSAPSAPAPEPRQRWRLAVARDADAPDTAQREVAATWTAAIEASGLPLVGGEGQRARSRVSFGAPLPVGMAAERELIDIVLTDRWPAWRVRDALARHIPPGLAAHRRLRRVVGRTAPGRSRGRGGLPHRARGGGGSGGPHRCGCRIVIGRSTAERAGEGRRDGAVRPATAPHRRASRGWTAADGLHPDAVRPGAGHRSPGGGPRRPVRPTRLAADGPVDRAGASPRRRDATSDSAPSRPAADASAAATRSVIGAPAVIGD